MPNRVVASIARMEERIKELNGVGLNGKPLDEFRKEKHLDMGEFVSYQNLQARAFSSGLLNMEEATTIYNILGGEVFKGDWPDGTSLASIIVVEQVMGELLGIKVK